MPATREHIVPKTPDHLRPEGAFQKESELKASYKNLRPARPVIHKLADHLKPEGNMARKSETATSYEDKKPQRPFIHKIPDHGEQVQPKGAMEQKSEYRKNFRVQKGERAQPTWVNNFAKVTIGGGTDTSRFDVLLIICSLSLTLYSFLLIFRQWTRTLR